jgi:hypothetical protein
LSLGLINRFGVYGLVRLARREIEVFSRWSWLIPGGARAV